MAGARNRAKMEQKNAIGAPSAPIRQTRLSGSWLLIARAVWLVLVVSSLGLFVAGLPLYYQHLQRPCIDALTCNVAGALTTHGLRALVVFGLSVSAYAALNTIFWASIVVIWSGIGFLLFWRRSDEWFPLLAAFALVIFNITYPGLFTSVLSIAYPALDLPVTLMSLLGQISIALLFLLFPNGRLVPRWTGLIVPLIIIQAVSLVAPPIFPVSQSRWPTWINGLLSLAIYGTIIFSQIHRYIRVSNRAERQQTKWVAFAITTVALGFLVLGLLFTVLFPQFNQPDTPYTLITLVYPLLLLLLPVSAGVAILRYRLWDIDIIIKRTLVYGLLTTFVVGFYVLAVGYLGVIFRTNGNLLISLIATGIVAVVFQPLRAFLQRAVNRLLYGL
ncbi:MAG: hypothetical protein J2P37_21760, partial [Ktedonobacteraceae bacterium]|nr:hypothetical protein [Ktedonobacteraceae bacterium]